MADFGNRIQADRRGRRFVLKINVFDIVLAGLPVAFLLLGLLHTAWQEFFSLLGVAAGALLAGRFGPQGADWLRKVLPDSDLSQVITFLAILVAGFLVGGFVGGMADRMREGGRGDQSRLLPALFGLVKGLIFGLAVYWLVDAHVGAFHRELSQSTVGDWYQRLLSEMLRRSPW